MNMEYHQQRLEARNTHMRTSGDGTKVILTLTDGQLVVDMPPRLDYLVITPAIHEANKCKGKVTSVEVRMHQTQYIDSSGVGLLLILHSLLPAGSDKPRLSGVVHSGVKLPLTYANLDKIFAM